MKIVSKWQNTKESGKSQKSDKWELRRKIQNFFQFGSKF